MMEKKKHILAMVTVVHTNPSRYLEEGVGRQTQKWTASLFASFVRDSAAQARLPH